VPESDYDRCKFSITCHTDDLAVVHCLRGLCQYAEKGRVRQISWGGTKESEWRAAGNNITLRFTNPVYRDVFVKEAARILPQNSWTEVRRSDADPAHRQRASW
jgi:hypothetical protein